MTKERIAALRLVAGTGAQGEKSKAIRELCDYAEKREAKKRPSAFTLREVMTEAERMEWPKGMAEQCFDCYDAVGWVRGSSKLRIVSLPATMRNWKRNHEKWNAPAVGNGTKANHFRI